MIHVVSMIYIEKQIITISVLLVDTISNNKKTGKNEKNDETKQLIAI